MKAGLMLSYAVVAVGVGLSLGGGNAFGYAGEKGTVGSNVSPATVSTHHLHLTRALAYCAGFEAATSIQNPVDPVIGHPDKSDPNAAKEAEIIAIYDELTDQGTIKDGMTTWTNIVTPWSYTDKIAGAFPCAEKEMTMVFPVLAPTAPPDLLPDDAFWDPEVGWFTNRFGPWAGQFHFPTSDDLTRMNAFAMAPASGQTLYARTLYALGATKSTLWTADCYPDPYQTPLNTGSMTSGSLAALGTYLHSIGDSYSHGVCSNNWPPPANYPKPPWVYHTPAIPTLRVPGCAFNSHSLEFGCPATPEQAAFENNVVIGGIKVFEGLLEYGEGHGKIAKLKTVDAHQNWLRRQLERYTILYKTNTFPEAGACRVSFTYALMKACDTAAVTASNACLSDVVVDCPDGKVGACEPHSDFISTQPCSTSASTTTTATR